MTVVFVLNLGPFPYLAMHKKADIFIRLEIYLDYLEMYKKYIFRSIFINVFRDLLFRDLEIY